MKHIAECSRGLLVLTVFLSLLSIGISIAAETPASLAGATIVDAPKAKALMDGGAVMIDSRVANEYAEAHIKGAKSVPYKEKSAKDVKYNAAEDSFDLAKLPVKSTPVIFACNGAECWKSYKASAAAVKAGYKKVYWFRGGFPAWKSHGFAIE